MRRQYGFTLIELMVVVAIVAIIAAIAIPTYTEQSRKGRRADAARVVGQLQLELERWRAENACYGRAGAAGCPASFTTESGTYPTLPTSDFYNITLDSETGTDYRVTAAPAGAQVGDRCGNLVARRSVSSGKPTWATAGCN